jgi:hypothetical protein
LATSRPQSSDAFDDDLVESSVFELGLPVSSCVGLPESPGEGGQAAHCVAAAPRERGARDDSGGHHEDVSGGEGVDSLGHLLEEVVGDGAHAPEVGAVPVLGGLLGPDGLVGEIDPEGLTVVSVRHTMILRRNMVVDCFNLGPSTEFFKPLGQITE